MEDLSRFDIAEFNGHLMVVVESELLPPDTAIVVVPLLADYPAIKDLNPTITLHGRDWVLATRLIASVQRSALRKVGTAAAQGDQIIRAVDILMSGV